MKTMKKFLSMAALALVGAMMTGCSSDDNIEQQPKKNIVTVKTTISLDSVGDESDGEGTRALDYNFSLKTCKKSFAEGDQIAVIYTNTSDQTVKATSVALKAKDISDAGKTASFTVTLENPKAGTVEYVYPAAMANEDGTAASILSQDGTLATLASNYDYARGSGEMTVAGSAVTLPEVSLTNQFAICNFRILDVDKAYLLNDCFSQLTLEDGTNTYTITPSGEGNLSGDIYVALNPVTCALKATITNGTSTFEKTLTSRTYAANNVYQLGMIFPVKSINNSSVSIPNGTTWTIIGTGSATSNTITIGSGATANLGGVNISVLGQSPITCSGNATINLVEGTTNRATATSTGSDDNKKCGIRAGGSGTTLTINGPGTLYATGNEYGAGIGCNYGGTCGAITINGGEIHATGGYNAAGIGSSNAYPGTSSCGTITIHGGTVEARGGVGGAGIGAGAGFSSYSSISIDGGNVTAYGGTSYGAGIGSGESNTSAGSITISGASTVVNATGAEWAAGIGSGYSSTCGNITIYGGNITAMSGEYGAGIGAGYSRASCGNILIDGGTIRAWCYDPDDYGYFYSDGIGTASESTCGTITITSAVTEVRTNSAIGGEHVPDGYDYDCYEGSHGTVTVDWSKVIHDWY